MSSEHEVKVTGCLPVFVLLIPWWVGAFVIVRATLGAIL